MPNGKKYQLDEFEAKIYKYIMSFNESAEDFAWVLTRVEREILEGKLQVRKDLIEIIIGTLPEAKKKAILEHVYIEKASAMMDIGERVLYGKDFRKSKGIDSFVFYNKFYNKAAGIIIRDTMASDGLGYLDNVVKYLGPDKKLFDEVVSKEFELSVDDHAWSIVKNKSERIAGLHSAMFIDEEDKDIMVEADKRGNTTNYQFYFRPTPDEYAEKYINADKENREKLFEEMRGYGREAQELLKDFEPYIKKLPVKFVERLKTLATLANDANMRIIDISKAAYHDNGDKINFAGYREQLLKIDPAIKPIVEKAMAYSNKVGNAIINHVKNGDFMFNTKIQDMKMAVKLVEDNKGKDKDLEKIKRDNEEKINAFLKRKNEKEEKAKEEDQKRQQKLDEEKSKRKLSDIILLDEPAPDKVLPKGRLEAAEISDYFKYLELALEKTDFEESVKLVKFIYKTTNIFEEYDEFNDFRNMIDDIIESNESFNKTKPEWIKSLREIMEKCNDKGFSKIIYLRSFNEILARVPHDIKEKDNKHAINVGEGAQKPERLSFAEGVLGYLNEAIINANNAFKRPVQEVNGEKETILRILSGLEKKLREDIPALKNTGDFPAPDYNEIESEGVQVYLKKLDNFLLSHLKEENDFKRLKAVESYYDIEKKNLGTVAYINRTMFNFVDMLFYEESDRTLDMKKYVVDKFRGQLVKNGVDLSSSVRDIDNIIELELWCSDAVAAISNAIETGLADEEKIFEILEDYNDDKTFDYKTVRRKGYDANKWKKEPLIQFEYKHVYDEDTWTKEEIKATEDIHNNTYLHKTLKIEEFLSKKDENLIGRALFDAGYDKEMTRWMACKKILIYAMGVHNKSLDDISKMSAEEKAEMGRLFAKDVSSHPFNSAKMRDLSGDAVEENALWYGKMYGDFYKHLYKEEMILNEAKYADKLNPLPDFSGSKLYGISTIINEIDSDDLVLLNSKEASKVDNFNVHGIDRLSGFKEGFDFAMGKGGYDKAVAYKKQIVELSNLYYRMTAPEYNHLVHFICKLIVQYEIEPKIAGVDFKTDDEETKKKIEELSENIARANKILESDGFKDLLKTIRYDKRDSKDILFDVDDAKYCLNNNLHDLKWIKQDFGMDYNGERYQAVLGFIAKNIPGTPEIVKLYAQLPLGLKDEIIQKAVDGGYPQDIKAETRAGKEKKNIQDEQERERARIAEEERQRKEAERKAEEIRKRDERINALEKDLIPKRVELLNNRINEYEKLVKENAPQKSINSKTAQLCNQKKLYFAERRELRHLICDRDFANDPDRLTYEKSLATVIEIRDLRKAIVEAKDFFKAHDYPGKILTLSGDEYTALSNLRRTDYFYQERERIYKTCLEEVLKSKGVDINDPNADDTKVTVEEIMAQKELLFKDSQYSVFDESDMRIEMEDRLIKENETAREISEMLDNLYNYKNDLDGSNKYKNTDRPRMPKKFSPGAIDDEMMPANMRDMQAAAALRKGIDVKGKDAADYETTYETASIFLDQLLKIAVHKDYLVKLFNADEAQINDELKTSFTKKDDASRKTANNMHMDSYKAVTYMTQFFPHYAENGPRYYAKYVIPDLLRNLTEQYRRAKNEGTKKAMLDFYKAIDGACFDFVADNIQKFASAHPLNDIEKEMYTLPDPGHGGIYVHDSRLLQNIVYYNQMAPENCDTFESAILKLITALNNENDGERFRWDDIEKEIIYQFAGKRFKDVDLTNFDPETLINDPDKVKLLEEMKQKCLDYYVIDEDPEEIVKNDYVEEDEVPDLDEKSLSKEELKQLQLEKRRKELQKEVDEFNYKMQKAYDDMRSIASDISYTVVDLEKYEDGRDYKIPKYNDDKRIRTVELYDKIFGDYKKVMDFKKYKFNYKFDFYPNENKKESFESGVDFESCFRIYDTRKKLKLRPEEFINQYCGITAPIGADDERKFVIMYALTEPNSRYKVTFTPLKARILEEKRGKNTVLSTNVFIDEEFEVPTFRDDAFLQHRRQARYKEDLAYTTYERSFKMKRLGTEKELKDLLATLYGNDAEYHHPHDIRSLFFAWICNRPDIEDLEDFYTDLRLDSPRVQTLVDEFKADVMKYRFDWSKGYYAKIIGGALKRVRSIKMQSYYTKLTAGAAERMIRDYDSTLQGAVKLLGTVIPYDRNSSDFRTFIGLLEKEYGQKNVWQHADQVNFIYECYKNVINPDLSLKERVLNFVVVDSLRKPFLGKNWNQEIFDAEKVRAEMKLVDVDALELSDEDCELILNKGLKELDKEKHDSLVVDIANVVKSAIPLVNEAPKIDRPFKIKPVVQGDKSVKDEVPVKHSEPVKRPKDLGEIGKFNNKVYECINKIISTDFNKLFAENNMMLPDAFKLKNPSKLTKKDLKMTDAMFDLIFGDLVELQKTFPKEFLDSFNIYSKLKDKQSVKNKVKDELVRLKSEDVNNVKYVNSLTRVQILRALFDDKLMIGFTPKLYSEDNLGATEINSNCRLFINRKFGIKRPVQVTFKNKIEKLNKENHDSIFELKTNKFEMYKKNFALEVLTMEDLRSAEKEFNRLFGGEIDNDHIEPHKFKSYFVAENSQEVAVWDKCVDIRNAFKDKVQSNDPALSNMDKELRSYFVGDAKISKKQESAFNGMIVKAYILHALGKENTVIKVKNDYLGDKEVSLNTHKRNERQQATYERDEKIFNYKIEADERIKQDNGRFGTLSVARQFSYDSIFNNPDEAIKQFKQLGFNNGENASGFYILYCLGVLKISVEDLVKATPEKKKEYGDRFIKDFNEHKFNKEFWKHTYKGRFKENLKWYGDFILRALEQINKENLKMPSGNAFKNVEAAEKYVASKNWVMTLVNDALKSISSKNLLEVDSDMEYMFDDSKSRKTTFKNCRVSLSKALPLNKVFDGMLNPAYSIRFHAYQKLVGETEVSCLTRNTSVIDKKSLHYEYNEENTEIIKSINTLNTITALDWDSIIAVEEKMKDFTEDEINLIMNNSFIALAAKKPNLVLKVMDTLVDEEKDLFRNLKQAKTLLNNIATTQEDKIKHLTGVLATMTFGDNDPEMLYSLRVCSVENTYHENLKYENTKPEDLAEAERVFNEIFGENVDLDAFVTLNKNTTMSAEVDEVFANIDKGNNISDEVRLRFKKAYILHSIVRNGATYGVGDNRGVISAAVKSEKRRTLERKYKNDLADIQLKENTAKERVKNESVAPYESVISNINNRDLSEIYLLKINRPNKLDAEMNVGDFMSMSEAELDKCDKLFDKIFGELIKQQKPLYEQYTGRKKSDFYQDLFYPGNGEYDFLKLVDEDGNFSEDGVTAENYEIFKKASVLHALAMNGGRLDIHRYSKELTDVKTNKIVVTRDLNQKTLTKPNISEEVQPQMDVLLQNDSNMDTARNTIKNNLVRLTGRHFKEDFDPNYMWEGLDNPPTGSDKDMAKNCMVIYCMAKAFDKEATLDDLNNLNTYITSRDFNNDITNLKKNVVFKAVKKEAANPVKMMEEWTQVAMDSDKIRSEYEKDLSSFMDARDTLADFVLQGFVIEVVPEEDVENNEINTIVNKGMQEKDYIDVNDNGMERLNRVDADVSMDKANVVDPEKLKERMDALIAEEDAAKTINERYQRLTSIITAQILSDKSNIKLIQGFVTGHFDLMTVTEKTIDYLKKNKVLGENGDNFNKDELNRKLADGTFKNNVIKDVMGKEKTSQREKQYGKKSEIEDEAGKDNLIINPMKK
ncbi:MAG: hypothetical protein K6F60_06760 [Eubacterium sp.]|nr:hypothetical protein [Eubacterium sp.]